MAGKVLTPEEAERRKERARERYANMTVEQRQARNAYQREYDASRRKASGKAPGKRPMPPPDAPEVRAARLIHVWGHAVQFLSPEQREASLPGLFASAEQVRLAPVWVRAALQIADRPDLIAQVAKARMSLTDALAEAGHRAGQN